MMYFDIDASGTGSTNKKLSLQEAFEKFRRQRQEYAEEDEKMRECCRFGKEVDHQHVERLRKKFLEQAKKYFGVPYARKYWPPDSPEYKLPLYLDCCGLVRQVVKDLQKDFGFRLGPWNQAYMYDTLPITVDNIEDMKPGDLVFMSGIYTNKKSKKQRHNMTHVEIWYGEGEKTIGSRWNNGKVQIFDSYRFAAKSFHSEQYYFKSIDTWLKGICRSFCPLHPWRRTKHKPKKKSVFKPADDKLSEEDEKAEDTGTETDGDSINPREDILDKDVSNLEDLPMDNNDKASIAKARKSKCSGVKSKSKSSAKYMKPKQKLTREDCEYSEESAAATGIGSENELDQLNKDVEASAEISKQITQKVKDTDANCPLKSKSNIYEYTRYKADNINPNADQTKVDLSNPSSTLEYQVPAFLASCKSYSSVLNSEDLDPYNSTCDQEMSRKISENLNSGANDSTEKSMHKGSQSLPMLPLETANIQVDLPSSLIDEVDLAISNERLLEVTDINQDLHPEVVNMSDESVMQGQMTCQIGVDNPSSICEEYPLSSDESNVTCSSTSSTRFVTVSDDIIKEVEKNFADRIRNIEELLDSNILRSEKSSDSDIDVVILDHNPETKTSKSKSHLPILSWTSDSECGCECDHCLQDAPAFQGLEQWKAWNVQSDSDLLQHVEIVQHDITQFSDVNCQSLAVRHPLVPYDNFMDDDNILSDKNNTSTDHTKDNPTDDEYNEQSNMNQSNSFQIYTKATIHLVDDLESNKSSYKAFGQQHQNVDVLETDQHILNKQKQENTENIPEQLVLKQTEDDGSEFLTNQQIMEPTESDTGDSNAQGAASNNSSNKKGPSSTSNNNNIDNKSDEKRKRGGGKRTPGGRPVKLPACSLPSNMISTFYIGGGNGVSLVEGALLNLGWKRTVDKTDERFKLKWVECKSKINYQSFREGEQLVNHIPNCQLLTNKLGLVNSLQEYERVTLSTKGRPPRLKISDIFPETYKLDDKNDRETFLQNYKGEMWICKPTGMNQGKGIFLLRNQEEIDKLLSERDEKQQQRKAVRPLMSRIVQRYIHNPLLLEGRKFDIRAYMLIAGTCPYLVLYHKGYVRLSCMPYDGDDTNLTTHLTNQCIQKKDPSYNDVKEDTAWTMDKFNEYINEKVAPEKGLEPNWVYNYLTKQMQRVMLHCFNSVKHKLQCKIGYFDLYGLDFMVDTDMKVWLIEINVNPSLSTNCEALKDVIPSVVEEAINVSIECFEKSRKHQSLHPINSLKGFSVLFCGAQPNAVQPRLNRNSSPNKDGTEKNSGSPYKRSSVSPSRSFVPRTSISHNVAPVQSKSDSSGQVLELAAKSPYNSAILPTKSMPLVKGTNQNNSNKNSKQKSDSKNGACIENVLPNSSTAAKSPASTATTSPKSVSPPQSKTPPKSVSPPQSKTPPKSNSSSESLSTPQNSGPGDVSPTEEVKLKLMHKTTKTEMPERGN